jgi:hypothetical protein
VKRSAVQPPFRSAANRKSPQIRPNLRRVGLLARSPRGTVPTLVARASRPAATTCAHPACFLALALNSPENRDKPGSRSQVFKIICKPLAHLPLNWEFAASVKPSFWSADVICRGGREKFAPSSPTCRVRRRPLGRGQAPATILPLCGGRADSLDNEKEEEPDVGDRGIV